MAEKLIKELQHQQRENEKSIQYASYIQQALFPHSSFIKSIFPEHFILFKPCDVVSGDFYWFYKKDNKLFVAAADCTGHGVPGAFMSILGISLLNQIVATSNVRNAATVLNLLREYIMDALNQTGIKGEQKDGIDMALAIITPDKNQIDFAGAFNPLYLVRNNQLLQYSGNNMPIGIGADFEEPFTNHIIELKNNDMIYLFSDGFADQFGGPNNKKFKYRPFRKLLTQIATYQPNEQKNTLETEFENWKGDYPQLDDVLLIGIRYLSLTS